MFDSFSLLSGILVGLLLLMVQRTLEPSFLACCWRGLA
jgi:hypothetical protein